MTVSAVRLSARLAGTSTPVYPHTERTLAGIQREGQGAGAGLRADLPRGSIFGCKDFKTGGDSLPFMQIKTNKF